MVDQGEEEERRLNPDVSKIHAATMFQFKKVAEGGARQNHSLFEKESNLVGQRRGKESWEEILSRRNKEDEVVESKRKRAGLEKMEVKVDLKEKLTDKLEQLKRNNKGLVVMGGKERSLGEKQFTSLIDPKNGDEENKRVGFEAKKECREKQIVMPMEERSVEIAKLEQVATLKGVFGIKGISKVAVTGLSVEQKKRCLLPSSLLVDDVRSADLLFVRCSDNGVPLSTPNFYLGRAYSSQVVNASFLIDWEENRQLPKLEDYVVVGSYLKRGEPVPLKPIKEPLMIGKIFCITSFKGSDHPVDLTMELIIRMGGRIVDEECDEDKIHFIGTEVILGKKVFRPDWIFDSVEHGAVLKKMRFLVEPPQEQDGETIFSQVPFIESYSNAKFTVDC